MRDNGMLIGFFAFLISILLCVNIYRVTGTKEDITITISEKQRISSEKSSKYLIFTKNEVFENTDVLLLGKFNSSDLYGKFNAGETYKVQVIGWRVPFMSWYRNIVRIYVEDPRQGPGRDRESGQGRAGNPVGYPIHSLTP